jgi:ribosomal protein S27AE
MKERYVKICPQCGSTNIKIPPAGMDLKMTKRDYCSECGNFGIFPEILESEKERFSKKIKDEKHN